MAPTRINEAPICGNCARISSHENGGSLQRCAGCYETYYCSKNCQKVDWSKHKKTCKPTANIPIPGVIQIGPVTTVREVLQAQADSMAWTWQGGVPTTPKEPMPWQESMVNPTAKEVYERCMGMLDAKKRAGNK